MLDPITSAKAVIKDNEPPRICFLDDSEDLRSLLIHLMRHRYHESCYGCGSVREMVLNKNTVLDSKVVVLDVNLGVDQPTGIDAYEWLKQQNYQGKVLFLTGHARSHPEVRLARESGADVIEKPVDAGNFVSYLADALKAVDGYS